MAAANLVPKIEIFHLEVKSHFENLSNNEKLYAHWMSRAAFEGTRIVLRQNSEESERIFDLIMGLHLHCGGHWDDFVSPVGISSAELTQFLEYAAKFLGNLGNYDSSSNRKFHPQLDAKALGKMASKSSDTFSIFDEIASQIYSGVKATLGYPDETNQVFSNYYPNTKHLTKNEVTRVQSFMDSRSLLPENTRLSKTEGMQSVYQLHIASERTEHQPADSEGFSLPPNEDSADSPGTVDATLRVQYGDHSDCMGRINQCLRKAKEYTANAHQDLMIDLNIRGFYTGNMEDQKQAQAHWVGDQHPQVESLHGFLLSYTDPHSVRAEWRGFVLLRNQPETESMAELVSSAGTFLELLPWNKHGRGPFEVEKYTAPNYTSMEALSFVGSYIPAGTNLPNHDDIVDQYGFKNLEIRNRIINNFTGKVPFLSEDDSRLFSQLASSSFSMLVVLHELLGHGSGKHLAETSENQFNFDRENPPLSPLTKEPVDSWYRPGETFNSVFGWSYEECRSDLVSLYLSLSERVVDVFRFPSRGIDSRDAVYIAFLYIIRAGLFGLTTWDPDTKNWKSAHDRARFAITKHLWTAGVVDIDFNKEDPDAEPIISLHRDALMSSGREVLEPLLMRIHVYSCTADRKGIDWYDSLSAVEDSLMPLREAVLRSKASSKQIIQGNTAIKDGSVVFKEYDASPAGMIQSWAERYL
ncbi:peptidase family M49-domain-containing protein [Diaporthe sp. PMI_573]|nr:peptidase family M49-domain-containing protein [Diaporthaceae sp. PMI_573]